VKINEYRLHLDIGFQRPTFRGRLEIVGENDAETLTLNAVDLSILAARSGGRDLEVRPDPSTQSLGLSGLPRGPVVVELEYEGRIGDGILIGLYRSAQAPDSIITTQCESTGARRILPCLDRPDRKATFDVEVTVDEDREVIFNTPAIESRLEGGRKRVRFARTPQMATYLLYLGIGTFEVVRERTDGGRVAAWMPPGSGPDAAYSVDLASRLLAEYERYYGLPYPLPKLDLVSIQDFAPGAMENWGAITFRDLYLGIDGSASTSLRRTIAVVLAHEIAHQWFGNLVTMRWWDDIWLNESFASFVSYKVIERLRVLPAVWSDFLLQEVAGAFLGDALAVAHPIRQPVEQPDDIDQVFDEISYGKGAAVLRMLEAFLGEETFRRGVQTYLERFQYGNARSEDLWAALEGSAGQPVAEMIRRWVERPGHPVLTVHRGSDGVHLEQRRFSLHGDHPRQYWPVPLLGSAGGRLLRMLMAGPEVTLNVGAEAELNLNSDALGFYRVLYDDTSYDRLRDRLPERSEPERWAVIRDLFAFLLSGDVELDRYLRFVERLESETGYLVVNELTTQLATLRPLLTEEADFVQAATRFYRRQLERVGLARRSGEDEVLGALRERVVGGLASLDPDFAEELAGRYGEYDALDPDVRGPLLVAYARRRGAAAYPELRERFRRSTGIEALRALRALGASDNPVLVRQTLAMGPSGECPVSSFPFALIEAVQRPAGRAAVWEWLPSNVEFLRKGLMGSSFLPLVFERLIPLLGLDRAAEVRTFFSSQPPAGAERGVRKGLEFLGIFLALQARAQQ
jgi:tricorn protease interacting factor F2/3